MSFDTEKIHKKLFEMQDTAYKDFQSKLMPTVDKDTIIGIRIPLLRRFAKEYAKSEEAKAFMSCLPHTYYEENNLHGYMLEYITDYDTVVTEIEKFLPYINNWATCDTVSPGVLGKYPDRLIVKIKEWISSDKPYTVRYGLGMLMRYFLDGNFKKEYLDLAVSVKSEEYYVKMMVAWFFATSLAKQYDDTLPYIAEGKLENWTHNKTISKAIESYRVSDTHKATLKMYRKSAKSDNI